MALNGKDWEFVYGVLEGTARAMYARGYEHGQKKDETVKLKEIRMSAAEKMKLQTLYKQTMEPPRRSK
jgi:hypothetical protein